VQLDLSSVGADRERTISDAGGCGLDLNIRLGNVYDRRDRVIGRVMVARDVTAQLAQQRALQDANQQLRDQLHTIEALRAGLAEQAVRDHLTGLHNRRHLAAELDAALLVAGARGEPLAVVLLDIDHFKQINDRYGHAAGDAVLVHLAGTLSGAVRPDDLLARHGGEEFVLVMRGLDAADAVRRADDLRRLVRDRPAVSDGHRIAVTFSAGVAAFTGAESADDLLRLADQALYAAKRNGRDRIEPAPQLVDHPARQTPVTPGVGGTAAAPAVLITNQ
jgi:diguanylate cyclase (GGDEF)-like protein